MLPEILEKFRNYFLAYLKTKCKSYKRIKKTENNKIKNKKNDEEEDSGNLSS
jgi:hypothetical protein